MELTGRIILDLPLQQGTSKAGNLWQKKEWVLETPGQYPKKVKFHVFGEDKINNNHFEVGKDYTISYDIESREYNGRWYTDINVYASRPADTTSSNTGQWVTQPPIQQQQFQTGPQFGQPVQAQFETAQEPSADFGIQQGGASDDLPF
ncbi:MAG: DUF3127 domain-containing protein [Prevotella sp.]|nr:DUF3127 domain-containing protein [Bacteroides sp.]MCM1365914.1 DUF3127 domain-containing protein [Prevotella sp.]